MDLIALQTIFTKVGGDPIQPGDEFKASSKEEGERLIERGAAQAKPKPSRKKPAAAGDGD